MKICFLTDAWYPWWGGGQTHVWEVANKLVTNHDCEVDIIVPNLTDKSLKRFPKIEKYHNGKLRVVRLGSPFIFPNLLGRLLFVKDCLIFCTTNKYDLYHSHSYLTSIILPVLRILRRGKVVFTLHGMGSTMLGAGFLNRIGILNLINKFTVYGIKYDALITVAKKSLSERTKTKLVTVIGNGVNIEKFDEVNAKKKGKTLDLLWVGRMVPVKGLSLLISVFGELASKYPNLRLTLIGDGPERASLESFAKQLKLQNKIIFNGSILGKEKELIKIYKQSDVFILPSISAEGFPITVVEAMAAKLPVIASDIGDTDLLVQNGKTGFLVLPGNGQDLSEKIEKLIKDSKRVEMGQCGYNLVKQKYTWDLITQQVYEVYSKVLKH